MKWKTAFFIEKKGANSGDSSSNVSKLETNIRNIPH